VRCVSLGGKVYAFSMSGTYGEETVGVVREHVHDLARDDREDPHPDVHVRAFAARLEMAVWSI
jgi:hypothetical protein